jgi:hypothetical protein
MKCIPEQFKNIAVLDSTCLHDIYITKLNTQIVTPNSNYNLYSYQFDFEFTCSKDNWMSDTALSKKSFYRGRSDIYDEDKKMALSINLLHTNGLVAVDSTGYFNVFISGTSLIEEFVEKIMLQELDSDRLKKVIELRYYNYLPKDIEIDLKRNEFNFYSEILKRRFVGSIKFNEFQNYFELKLQDGILVND